MNNISIPFQSNLIHSVFLHSAIDERYFMDLLFAIEHLLFIKLLNKPCFHF